MDIKPFLKSLFESTLVKLHASTPDALQKEIAEGFLTFFGQFRDGELFILDNTNMSKLSAYELSEELPFTEREIEEYLSFIKGIKLNTQFTYNEIYVLPDNHWAIGGIYSIFKDLILGKVTFFTFPLELECVPTIGVSYIFSITLSNIKGEGLYLKVNPEYSVIEKSEVKKKYSGYYASVDGTMDAEVVINKFDLNFNLGNVLKYIIRAGKKDPSKHIEDLEKARKYIDFEIEKLKGE